MAKISYNRQDGVWTVDNDTWSVHLLGADNGRIAAVLWRVLSGEMLRGAKPSVRRVDPFTRKADPNGHGVAWMGGLARFNGAEAAEGAAFLYGLIHRPSHAAVLAAV